MTAENGGIEMTDMANMTKAEILEIWKGFVRNMSDQGAVVPFAHEIARRACNELLDRLEAAEKERDNANAAAAGIALQAGRLEEEIDALRARIAEMEQQKSIGDVANMPGTPGFTMACFRADDVPVGAKLYALPGARGNQ